MEYTFHKIPQSRIATFDVYSVGMTIHHITALLEFDVTESRAKIRKLKRSGSRVSFNAWIVKVIGKALEQHPEAAGFLYSKRKLLVFNDINISILVEKDIDGAKVPIPLVIEKANLKSVADITQQIENAKSTQLTKDDIVLNKQSNWLDGIYYSLPGILRRLVWRFMLNHPQIAYRNMGNVAITSLTAIGRINGWFIHKSVHPISFGVGSIIKKPVVIDDKVVVREMLNMTILIDHDVIDGAPMVRFLSDLTKLVEQGAELGVDRANPLV